MIDAIVVNEVEKAAQGFQKLTGKTNFWLAERGFYIIAGIAVVCPLNILLKLHLPLKFLLNYSVEPSGWVAGVLLACAPFVFITARDMRKEEKRAEQRAEEGYANPEKTWLFSIWRVGWCLFLGLSFVVAPDIYCAMFIVCSYLRACDPLPPCKGKIREWVESMGRKLVPVQQNV